MIKRLGVRFSELLHVLLRASVPSHVLRSWPDVIATFRDVPIQLLISAADGKGTGSFIPLGMLVWVVKTALGHGLQAIDERLSLLALSIWDTNEVFARHWARNRLA